ncbi:MAG: hypothetical protein JEZ06_14455 [Anaerolineaceae bacterium]|nr:hypothetical protein [Anaerolineaceae bacterium]
MQNNNPKFNNKLNDLENKSYRPIPTSISAKKTRSSSSTIWIIIISILVLVGICLGLNATQAGSDFIAAFFGNTDTSNANVAVSNVQYDDVYKYENQWISVQGYVIIPRNNIVCFGGWRICKLWFDDDPWAKGLGLHEIQVQTGRRENQISTDGTLRDFNGSQIKITENEVFNWYRIYIIGEVIDCDGRECSINVETIRGIK